MNDNRLRIFTDILSIDAWYSVVSTSKHKASVHVEMSFQEGRIGGDDPNFPFTFNLNIKRALVELIVSPPFTIDRNSIARGVPGSEIEMTRYKRARQTVIAAAGANLSINPVALFAKAFGKFDISTDKTSEEEARITEKVPPILIRAQPGGNSEYRWELEPSFTPFLEGQPWNPVEDPRLSINANGMRFSEGSIKIRISCKKEDLDIDRVTLKDGNLEGLRISRAHRDKNEAAAIQHIKNILEIADLEPGLMNNRFSSITLADVIAAPEVRDEF